MYDFKFQNIYSGSLFLSSYTANTHFFELI